MTWELRINGFVLPRHNDRAECPHRKDELRFYRHMRMYSLESGRRQLFVYQCQSNSHLMTRLGMKFFPVQCQICIGVSCGSQGHPDLCVG